MKFSHIIKNVVSSFVFALLPLSASAKCGNVDYSWGADALAGMHDYVVTMMLYVPKVLYKAECWRTKSNTFHNKTNCLSTIYEQNEIYNLS